MAAGDSHRVATLLLLLLPTADPREDLVKAVQEVISDVPEPKKCEITLMAAQKALDAGVPDRALALCDELAVVPYPRAARLAPDLLPRGRRRLHAGGALPPSRPLPPRELALQARQGRPCARRVPRAVARCEPPRRTSSRRTRSGYALRSRTTGRASASPSRPSPPVGTAATAEHRAVFMDALVKAAGAEDFDHAAHFALHFMAARASSVATLPGTTTLRARHTQRQRSCGRPLRRRRVLPRESPSTPYAPS